MENPKIRFKGFTKDWEQRKLGELSSSFEYGLNASAKEYDGENKYIRITDIDDDSREFKQKDITSPDTDLSSAENYRLSEGDILFARTGASVGKSYIYKASDGLVYYAGFLIRARIKPEYNSEFVFQNTLTGDYEKFIKVTSMRSGQPGVNAQEYSQYQIMVPSKPEQDKISDCLRNLDNLITLHQRKCEQTKNLKKYMLQKMFPQNGAKVPEIRFNGFTHDWEQRKLSHVLDIVTKRNGEKYGKEEVLSVSDEYGCINQIKFQGRSFAGEDISNYKIVDTGDIIYTRSPLKSKPYGIIKVVGDEIGIVSPLYIVNKVKEGNNSQFIYRVFDSPEKTNKYLSPLVRKGAKNTMNISNDEWLSGKIDVAPSYEEQYQIGLYFDHLDHLITLHQRHTDFYKKTSCYFIPS